MKSIQRINWKNKNLFLLRIQIFWLPFVEPIDLSFLLYLCSNYNVLKLVNQSVTIKTNRYLSLPSLSFYISLSFFPFTFLLHLFICLSLHLPFTSLYLSLPSLSFYISLSFFPFTFLLHLFIFLSLHFPFISLYLSLPSPSFYISLSFFPFIFPFKSLYIYLPSPSFYISSKMKL